jgi:DNA processing protein
MQMLKVVPEIGPRIADNIRSFSSWRNIEEELDRADSMGVEIVVCIDSRYPRNLLNIYDYPPFIYVAGTLVPDELCVAVVGSRLASVYGRFTTEKLSRELALKGVTVVSGLARGIDAAAHRGALAGRGRTIAVLGTGIDTIYPPENKKLAEMIVENGALVSEFSMGTPPNASNFPARNRIISGISMGVVVVEAGEKSGSLITARIAAEQGRSVFAVPGEMGAAGSRGTNHLIKQGATLLEDIDDIFEEIIPQAGLAMGAVLPEAEEAPLPLLNQTVSPASDKRAAPPEREVPSAPDRQKSMADGERELFALLSARPVGIETLIEQSGQPARVIQNNLLTLELAGLVVQLPGKNFIRKEQTS